MVTLNGNLSARTRLLALVEILTMYSDEQNIITIEEICTHLTDYGYEVSKRLVLADIKAVNETPLKIIGVSTPKKGYYIAKCFSQDAIYLILEAIFSSDVLSEKDTEYIKNYLRRNTCLPTLDLVLNTTVNLNAPAPRKEISNDVVHILRYAIRDKKQVLLTVSRALPGDTFSDAKKAETVKVNPVILAVANKNVALIFTREETPRKTEFINIPRIEAVRILGSEATEYSDDLTHAVNYFDGSSSNTSWITSNWLFIRFRKEVMEEVENHFNSPVQFRKDSEDGYYIAKVFTTFDDYLLGWLIALCDKIEVVAPQSLKDMLVEKAKIILN